MFIVAASGVVAGLVHVLSGPDHLAAVAPLAADSRRARWKTGFLWGVGHTGGVLLVGVLLLLLRGVLPLEAVSSWSERLVGVALVGVGLWGVRRALSLRIHVHEHAHGGTAHAHVHVHAGGDGAHEREARRHPIEHGHDHTHASFAFGVLHGLAGSSHVLGILPALALPTRSAAVLYMVSYGVGNVSAMTAFSSAMGLMASGARAGGPHVFRGLLYACSLAAVVVGGFWLML
jgi:hypothetical protein